MSMLWDIMIYGSWHDVYRIIVRSLPVRVRLKVHRCRVVMVCTIVILRYRLSNFSRAIRSVGFGNPNWNLASKHNNNHNK